MKRLNLRWPVLALLLALPTAFMPYNATTAFAQATSGGTITGVVSDPSGAVVAGATITVTDVSTKTKRTTVSNKNGQYVIPDVGAGSYDITVTKPGFSEDEIPALTVAVGTQTTANFKLAVGAESTVITVQASGADLQTMNASTAETLDPAIVESLPSVGRDASTFAAFQPGVAPGGAVAGTVSDQAVFQLDGGNNSSDMDGAMQSYTGSFGNSSTGGFLGASGSGVMPMPQDSVEEVRVATTGQTADFNNSSGLQASIVTKRGRDRWTGSVYEYYLDSNIGANSWQNNFPTACYTYGGLPTASCAAPAGAAIGTSTINNAGANAYTPKASYHFSRFGAAAGGPIAPTYLGGKTYLFANYEGFRYPAAATFERAVPSAAFLAGNLTYVGTGKQYTNAELQTADPRHLGQNPTLLAFYQKFLPNPSTPTAYAGTFDTSCTLVSSSYCDGVNTIGFKANISEPQSSNFFVVRLDHDFGAKWHFNTSYRYYKLTNQTGNQVDIGGLLPGDTLGAPKAVAPRPQQPWYYVAGLTTNISPTLTNDFHFSYLRNFWQWKDGGDAPQVSGWGGAIEPMGESASIAGTLAPTNVNAQSTRTRIWDGQDTFFGDNITKLKGDHIIQAGGQFQHNYNYHQRTDNGNAINYSTTYQIGDSSGGGLDTYPGLSTTYTYNGTVNTGGLTTPLANANFARVLDTYFGFVTDTQGANTFTNTNGTLNLNPPLTPIYAKTKIDYYNLYVTDTWHVKPSLTVNYGLSYAIETPPYETNGNQVMFVDQNGSAIQVAKFLANRKAQAMAGNVFNNVNGQTSSINPIVGTSLVRNVLNGPGNNKYPYNPFFGALSPRISAAWAPKFKSPSLAKIFGDNATVIRAGYGRIYGRINGVIQVLNPLLSPGLILATQCRYAQTTSTGGACLQPGFNDTTQFRFGTDGTTAPVALPPSSIMSPTSPVYRPGVDGPGVAIGSPLDPTYKPNDVDTFNFSIQRQVTRKMLVEVGYIGRLIHHELETLDPNAVPYQLTLNNQSFASAYLAVEGMFGCTVSASLCSTSVTPSGSQVAIQPFFEAALGGTGSAYCGSTSCTQAVITKQASNFRQQKVFGIWSALDNNTNGTTAPGFIFNRTLMGTSVVNTGLGNAATYGSNGQFSTGLSIGTATGYGNYNGAYVSFKISDFHGITLQENLTYSKALGLDDSAQSSSGLIASDSYDLRKSYGRQGYDQRYIFNTFVVYQSPYYKQQNGIIGRIAGGWTVSPVVTAGTGQPLSCGTNSGGQAFGGTDGSNFGDNENCVFTTPYTGGYRTHRGVIGNLDPLGVKVASGVHFGGSAAAVNMFNNPIAVWDTVRPAILGMDEINSGNGPISGLGYLNVDLSIKKKLVIYKKYSLELSAISTNVMNHLDFSSPSLSIGSSTTWGVTKAQGNSPRQIQLGVRAYF